MTKLALILTLLGALTLAGSSAASTPRHATPAKARSHVLRPNFCQSPVKKLLVVNRPLCGGYPAPPYCSSSNVNALWYGHWYAWFGSWQYVQETFKCVHDASLWLYYYSVGGYNYMRSGQPDYTWEGWSA